MTGAMRILAIAIALAGLIDPGLSITRRRPLPVDVRAIPSRADPDGVRAMRVRDALLDRMGSAIGPAGGAPRAIVAIGGGADAQAQGVPMSAVDAGPARPECRRRRRPRDPRRRPGAACGRVGRAARERGAGRDLDRHAGA